MAAAHRRATGGTRFPHPGRGGRVLRFPTRCEAGGAGVGAEAKRGKLWAGGRRPVSRERGGLCVEELRRRGDTAPEERGGPQSAGAAAW